MSDRKLFVVGSYCFTHHPCGVKSHWIRTNRCVAFVACEYCKARRGELCVNNSGDATAMTHSGRRKAYQQIKKQTDCSVKTMTLVIEEEQV